MNQDKSGEEHNTSAFSDTAFDEQAYVDSLFNELTELDAPVNVPKHLRDRLYRVPNTLDVVPKRTRAPTWALPASFAASFLIAGALIFSMQTRQNERELVDAQRELLLAFQYIDQANRAIEPHIKNTLREQLQRSTIAPVVSTTAESTAATVQL